MAIRRRLLRFAAVCIALTASLALAQAPPAPPSPPADSAATQPASAPVAVPQYDVISVKANKGDFPGRRLMFTPDGMNFTNIPVHMLLTECYSLNDDQIVDEPAWGKTEGFDIVAKVAGADIDTLKKLTFDQRRTMTRQVLADRFHLAAHRETRQLPVYLLSVAKGGVKFQDTKPDPEHPVAAGGRGFFSVRQGDIHAEAADIHTLTTFLSQQLGRTILDKTGLTGHYDFTLKWAPDEGTGPVGGVASSVSAPPPSPADNGPSVFTAIQEQLGLKLESGKGPVDVLVIDHIERPTQN